jgi:hypothetical protein
MDDQQKKQMIMLGVLLVVLVGGLVKVFILDASPAVAPNPRAAVDTEVKRLTVVDIDVDKLLEEIEVVPFNYLLNHIDRDPMRPLAGIRDPRIIIDPKEGIVAGPWMNAKVTGIIWDEHNPIAVIRDDVEDTSEDRVVYVGYKYADGVTVNAIEPTKVIFKVGDALYPIELNIKEF